MNKNPTTSVLKCGLDIDCSEVVSYYQVSERTSQGRVYRLLRMSIPKTSKEKRRRILDEILNEEKAIGIVEWWTRGSIIHKPKTEFQILVITEA
jgi:hypothetical protein